MGMTPKQIQKALREKKLTMADIGSSLRPPVSRTTVWKTVHQIKGAGSGRVQEAIARRLGRERGEVFHNVA